MKKIIHFAFLGLFFAVTLNSQAADKVSAKTPATPMEELNYKYEKLIQLNYQRHNEIMKALRDIREQGIKNQAASSPAPVQDEQGRQAEANVTASAPVVVEQAQPVATAVVSSPEPVTAAVPATNIPPPAPPAVTPEAQATSVATETPPTPVNIVTAPSVAPAAVPSLAEDLPAQPMPQTAAPEVKAEIPADFAKNISREISNARSFGILAFLVSLISLISMGVLIATVRKSDEKIRRMLWKSEVDHLRDEVITGRPQLKVEKSYDRLILTNVGAVVADDIKLSLGPAPRTMKQRLRVLARIEANEKAEVDIGPQQATDGQIFGTLEYKNPENAKLFKEQFILKVDGVTGELVPVQQAI